MIEPRLEYHSLLDLMHLTIFLFKCLVLQRMVCINKKYNRVGIKLYQHSAILVYHSICIHSILAHLLPFLSLRRPVLNTIPSLFNLCHYHSSKSSNNPFSSAPPLFIPPHLFKCSPGLEMFIFLLLNQVPTTLN